MTIEDGELRTEIAEYLLFGPDMTAGKFIFQENFRILDGNAILFYIQGYSGSSNNTGEGD